MNVLFLITQPGSDKDLLWAVVPLDEIHIPEKRLKEIDGCIIGTEHEEKFTESEKDLVMTLFTRFGLEESTDDPVDLSSYIEDLTNNEFDMVVKIGWAI